MYLSPFISYVNIHVQLSALAVEIQYKHCEVQCRSRWLLDIWNICPLHHVRSTLQPVSFMQLHIISYCLTIQTPGVKYVADLCSACSKRVAQWLGLHNLLLAGFLGPAHPNKFTLKTALSWVLRRTPAKWKVSQMISWQNKGRTDRWREIPSNLGWYLQCWGVTSYVINQNYFFWLRQRYWGKKTQQIPSRLFSFSALLCISEVFDLGSSRR